MRILWPIILLLCCLITTLYAEKRYRFQLDVGNPNNLCPPENKICENGQTHYLCPRNKTAIKCRCYKRQAMTQALRRIFVRGHNGIRNKMAEVINIANMNLVYWSKDLESMAYSFLDECQPHRDYCKYIGEKNKEVGQNFLFRQNLAQRWPGRAVRSWFLEIGTEPPVMNEWLDNIKMGEMVNFTQLIWPTTEFIGCGAARMKSSYMIVCYYHPPVNYTSPQSDVVFTTACTRCAPERPVCSKMFSGLCGIDYELNTQGASQMEINILTILFIPLIWKILFN